jgi:beta-phosphoglucomutase-like phosphatase (HAD superfamily)
MVVEDAVNGVMSGKAAGCFVVGLTTSFMAGDLAKAGADLVCASFSSLGSKVFENHRLCPSAGAVAGTPTKL